GPVFVVSGKGVPGGFGESSPRRRCDSDNVNWFGTTFWGQIMQFSRVVTPVKDIQIWNASSDGFSFVISYASRSGSGLRGSPGFVASWRPIHQNRTAAKVVGSPFKTLTAAQEACEVVLGHLIGDSPSFRRAARSQFRHASIGPLIVRDEITRTGR